MKGSREKKTQKKQFHRKLWWGWKQCGSKRETGLMLSEHDLSLGLQGHLWAESDCRTLQLSRNWRRGACSANRLPLLSSMDVVHSQRPHSCVSTTLYRMWLLNLFPLGVFSVCNQYSLPLRRTTGAGHGRVKRMMKYLNCQLTLEPVKLLLLLWLIRLWA